MCRHTHAVRHTWRSEGTYEDSVSPSTVGFRDPTQVDRLVPQALSPTKSSHCPHNTYLKHANTYSCNNHVHLHPNLLFFFFWRDDSENWPGPCTGLR